MGVRGLKKFMDAHRNIIKPHELHDIKVLIDGNAIVHHLVENSESVFELGGDYDRFAEFVEDFFKLFMECKIVPVIVFDGSHGFGKKFETLLSRFENNLNIAEETSKNLVISEENAKWSMSKHNSEKRVLFPPLSYVVFHDVAKQMNIMVARTSGEADSEIVGLANHFKCPVLGFDSDFYIYDIECGFIRPDSIENRSYSKIIYGAEVRYLKCEIYNVNNFLSCYPGIDKSLLPIFSSVNGNDYIDPRIFWNFFHGIGIDKKTFFKHDQYQWNKAKFLNHFKDYSYDECLKEVINKVDLEKKEVLQQIEEIKKKYNITTTDLLHFFNNNAVKSATKSSLSLDINVPELFVENFHKTMFPPFFIDVIKSHKIILSPQIEDPDSSSSHSCCLSIRKVLYGILTSDNVEEYDRKKTNDTSKKNGDFYEVKIIEPPKVQDNCELLKLNSLSGMDPESKKKLLLSSLGVNETFTDKFPSDMKLIAAVIAYWLKNSGTEICTEFVYALSTSLIYFHVIVPRVSSKESKSRSRHSAEPVDCERVEESGVISNLLKSVTTDEVKEAFEKLKPILRKNFKRGKCLDIVHGYSQLQACTLYSTYLNSLLGNVFENPKVQKCFKGTMIYKIVDKLRKTGTQAYISEKFGRSKSLSSLFSLLSKTLLETLPPKMEGKDIKNVNFYHFRK